VYAREAVALKLFPDFESLPRDELFHIQREACIMHQCRHPNIVSFVAADMAQGWLLMELAARSLHSALYQQPQGQALAPALRLLWLQHIACGLRYLHVHNIVHRDLKPLNVPHAFDRDYSPPSCPTSASPPPWA
jgi:serine/threonine protein kinase